MTRNCNVCGREYVARNPRSKFCGDACRKRNTRNPGVSLPAATVAPMGSEPPLVEVTRKTLADAARLDTIGGQQALQIAGRMSAGSETGSAMAALSRELRAVMAEALQGVQAAADPMDELRARRDSKRAG